MKNYVFSSEKINGAKIFAHIILVLFTVIALLPFILLISASLTDEIEIANNGFRFLPKDWSLNAYKYIFNEWLQIGRAYGVTILVTGLGTAGSLLCSSMFAYGLSQKNIPGIKLILVLLLLTLLFNGGIVPTYYVYTKLLNVRNTILGLLLPNLFMNAVSVILIRNFIINHIKDEIQEAAKMEGAGLFYIYTRIILPLSKPILATVGLFTAVAYWNDWINGLYYINDTRLYSIQQLLNKMNESVAFLANNSSQFNVIRVGDLPTATIKMAIAVVAVLPILLMYPFFHKSIAKGIAQGSVKG